MNAGSSNTQKRDATLVVRLALWFVAVFSLADFVPATPDPWRVARSGLESAACAAGQGGARSCDTEQILSAAIETAADTVLAGVETGVDNDAQARAAVGLKDRGPAVLSCASASQCADGQSLAAFNSRAPPAAA